MKNFDRSKEIILQLLSQNPESELYWVHLHLSTKTIDKKMSSQAIFRAYEVNSSSPVVLNVLLCHYYETKQISKFFSCIKVAQ